MSERVCVVIVTYNRKDLLRECLNAVLAQTRPPDHVLVVDNASTDGTSEMLKEEFPHVEVLRLPENQGSAGGYHEGMRRAYEMGFDWLWIMDDDGLPERGALQRLMSNAPELEFKGCLVLAKGEKDRLAFGVPVPGKAELEHDFNNVLNAYPEGIIEGYVNLFNGCLLHRRVISKIGFPLKELFIWGDEAEYFLRSKRCGIKMATLIEARFWHPEDRQARKTLRFFSFVVNLRYVEDDSRFYLILRNNVYYNAAYFSLFRATAKAILYLFIFPNKAPIIFQAMKDALSLLRRRKPPC